MQTVKIFARHLPESCISFGFPGDGARRMTMMAPGEERAGRFLLWV